MRWFVAMVMGVSVPSMAANCPTIGGIDAVIRPGTVLVLGKLYGTAESPAFVLDVACHATAADLPIVVGVELPIGELGRIDAFLDSTGAPAFSPTTGKRSAIIAQLTLSCQVLCYATRALY